MEQRHAWPLLHHSANALGLLMRCVPRPYRFTTARWLAMMLHPLIARTEMCRRQVAMGLDTSREVTLFVVLRFLTRMGCLFDVPVTHEGQFERGERGVLVAMAHTTLLYAMLRDLADRGLAPVMVEAIANPLLGTNEIPRVVQCKTSPLLRCHRHLIGKDVLIAAIDRADPTPRTVAVPLPARPVHVATPLLALAASANADLWFCAARTDTSMNITLAWQRATGADALGQFAAFLARELPSARASRRQGRALPSFSSGPLSHSRA